VSVYATFYGLVLHRPPDVPSSPPWLVPVILAGILLRLLFDRGYRARAPRQLFGVIPTWAAFSVLFVWSVVYNFVLKAR
jgi:hypothetical protein